MGTLEHENEQHKKEDGTEGKPSAFPRVTSVSMEEELESPMKDVNERITHYLQTYPLHRLLGVTNELHDEVRETEEAVQTLIYENYTQFMSVVPAIRSTDSGGSASLTMLSGELNSAFNTFWERNGSLLERLQPAVARCRRAERLQLLLKQLILMSRLPHLMQKDLDDGRYSDALRHFQPHMTFLEEKRSHHLFAHVYDACHLLSKKASHSLYVILDEGSRRETEDHSLLVQLVPDIGKLSETIEVLVAAHQYENEHLLELWSRCCVTMLRCECKRELGVTRATSNHQSCPPSLLKSNLLITSVILPKLTEVLGCVSRIFTSVPVQIVERTRITVLMDCLRFIFSTLLEDAFLTEDYDSETAVQVATAFRRALEPVDSHQDVARLFEEFLKSFASLSLRRRFQSCWRQYLHQTFIPLLKDSADHCAFTIGVSSQRLCPPEKELFALVTSSAQAADALVLTLSACIQACEPIVSGLFSKGSNAWNRLSYETEHGVTAFLDALDFCVDVFLGFGTVANCHATVDQRTGGNAVDLLGSLTTESLVHRMPAYTHSAALGIVLCLHHFRHNGVTKLCTTLKNFFLMDDVQRLPRLERQCQDLANTLLREVTSRWGREITHLYNRLANPAVQRTVPFVELGAKPEHLLLYETLRTQHVFRFIFGSQQQQLPGASRILDSARHVAKLQARTRRDPSCDDSVHVERLLGCQEYIDPPLRELPDPWAPVAGVARVACRGILELIRDWTVYPFSVDVAQQMQLQLILCRDAFHPYCYEDVSRSFTHPYGWTIHTRSVLAERERLFDTSDAFIEDAILAIVTGVTGNGLDMNLILDNPSLEQRIREHKNGTLLLPLSNPRG